MAAPRIMRVRENGRIVAGDQRRWPILSAARSDQGYVTLDGDRSGYARATALGPELDLLVAREDKPERATLHRLALAFAASGVALVAIAFALAWWRSRGLARRLVRINRAYREADDDAIAALEGDPQPDEIGELARRSGRALARVRRLLEAQRHVSDHVAHELRTPLLHLESRLARYPARQCRPGHRRSGRAGQQRRPRHHCDARRPARHRRQRSEPRRPRRHGPLRPVRAGRRSGRALPRQHGGRRPHLRTPHRAGRDDGRRADADQPPDREPARQRREIRARGRDGAARTRARPPIGGRGRRPGRRRRRSRPTSSTDSSARPSMPTRRATASASPSPAPSHNATTSTCRSIPKAAGRGSSFNRSTGHETQFLSCRPARDRCRRRRIAAGSRGDDRRPAGARRPRRCRQLACGQEGARQGNGLARTAGHPRRRRRSGRQRSCARQLAQPRRAAPNHRCAAACSVPRSAAAGWNPAVR